MATPPVEIADVRAVTLRVPLPAPVTIGRHVIADREYTLVVATATDGRRGSAYGLTRGAPLTAMVRDVVAPRYRGVPAAAPEELFEHALRSNPTVLCAGTGLRGLSLVDMAVWEALASSRGESLERLLGGDDAAALEGLLVIGFPPTMTAAEIAAEAMAMHERGWRTFKLAIGDDLDRTRARLEAAAVAPEVRLVLDAAWTWHDADDAERWGRALADLPFAWVEDPFPPGDPRELRRLRELLTMRLGAGDEQGGPGFPESLVEADAIDVLRLDVTAVGGVTGFVRAVAAVPARIAISCHVHGLLHAQLLRGLGRAGWVEFGRPGSGVDPLGDVLVPAVVEGAVPTGELRDPEPAIDEERLLALGCDDAAELLAALACS